MLCCLPKSRFGPFWRQPTDSMPQHYDSLEARDPRSGNASDGRASGRWRSETQSPGWARIFADVDPAGSTAAQRWQSSGHAQNRTSPSCKKAERPSAA